MIHRSRLRLLPLLVAFAAIPAFGIAQNLSIASTNGTTTVFQLANVQSLTFKNGNVIVDDTECGNHYFSRFFTSTIDMGMDASISNSSLNNGVLVYPNPVSNSLSIQRTSSNKTTATIFSMLGENVKSFDVFGSETSINVSELSSGVYLIGVDQQLIKFVKQ